MPADVARLPALWQHLADTAWGDGQAAQRWLKAELQQPAQDRLAHLGEINHFFGLPSG